MNRINEIRLHSPPEQWHYVPTSQNLADFCTRFVPFSKSKFNQSWLNSSTLLEQQVNSISADNESNKLLEIEEKFNNNLIQTKGHYQSFIKWNHYYSLKKTCITYCMSFKILKTMANSKTKIIDNRNSKQN